MQRCMAVCVALLLLVATYGRAFAVFGGFDYAKEQSLSQTGSLVIAYKMSGLLDNQVAVSARVELTREFRCNPRGSEKAVERQFKDVFNSKEEDIRDTVLQPDGTRSAQGQLKLQLPLSPPAGYCADGRVRLIGYRYSLALLDDHSGAGSKAVVGGDHERRLDN